MIELLRYRPAYVIGDGGRMYADAHRLVRNVIAIARIVEVPFDVVEEAAQAVERVENSHADERRYTLHEVRVIAELVGMGAAALEEALDPDQRPRGARGLAILREAQLPQVLASGELDRMRVFELDNDGRVRLVYPRMSLFEIREQLPRLVEFLRHASSLGAPVALVE